MKFGLRSVLIAIFIFAVSMQYFTLRQSRYSRLIPDVKTRASFPATDGEYARIQLYGNPNRKAVLVLIYLLRPPKKPSNDFQLVSIANDWGLPNTKIYLSGKECSLDNGTVVLYFEGEAQAVVRRVANTDQQELVDDFENLDPMEFCRKWRSASVGG